MLFSIFGVITYLLTKGRRTKKEEFKMADVAVSPPQKESKK